MTHLGSLEGLGRLLIQSGYEVGVHSLIDVFQGAGERKLAGGSLTGDPVALSRVPTPTKAVLELSDGYQAQVLIVDAGRGTIRMRVQDAMPGF